jgi:hypothetical protein
VLSDSEIVRWAHGQSGEAGKCSEDEDVLIIPEKHISHSSALE